MLFVSLNSSGEWTMRQGTNTLNWEGIFDAFNSLGSVGYELVSVVSYIGDTNPQQNDSGLNQAFANLMAGPLVTNMTQHKAGTTGYLFAFKKEIED